MKTNDISIVKLLENIHTGKIQLPDFQRSWVWDDIKIRKLIAGVTNSYPIGAFTFLSYGNPQVKFKYRTLEGAPNCNFDPEEMILDGQQRLTAIYLAMYSSQPVKTKTDLGKDIEVFYYLDIEKALDLNCDRFDAVISVPKSKIITQEFRRKIVLDLSTREKEFQNKMFPLNIIFDSAKTLEWQTSYFEYHKANVEVIREYMNFQSNLITKLQQYQVPVISMEKETPLEAVCQVFENVNTSGVSLTVFELVTASFAMNKFDLRNDWEQRREKFFYDGILSIVASTDFLAACTLLSSYKRGGAVSGTRKDILKLKLESYQDNAESLTKGFIESKNFLNDEGIFDLNCLPYSSQLIPLAVICALLYENNSLHIPEVREKLRQWYWCGVFGELYGGVSEGRYSNEIKGVMKWINDSWMPSNVVQTSYFMPMRLIKLQNRNSAAYKGFIALILKNHCRDFISDKEIDFKTYSEEKIEIHHIFPQKYCERMNYEKSKWNSILNKTPISAITNRKIGSNAPSKYIKKILNDNPDVNLEGSLASHWVEYEDLRTDNFDGFIAHRATYLLNAVEKVMGKKIWGRDTDEVKKFFGRVI